MYERVEGGRGRRATKGGGDGIIFKGILIRTQVMREN